MRSFFSVRPFVLSLALATSACGGDGGDPGIGPEPGPGSGSNQIPTPATMVVSGLGAVKERWTAELAVRGGLAYTTTWGFRGSVQRPAATYVWDVAGAAPVLVDSVLAPAGVTTLGDVAVSDDGRWLVVAAEPGELSLLVYDLANPRKPVEVSRFSVSGNGGAHTAEIATVNGKLHAFLALNRRDFFARLMIVDLSTPSAPKQVYAQTFSTTSLHDTHYRDGILFLNTWNEGLVILDVGGGGKGGTLAAPVELGRVKTLDGNVHNATWFHDPATGSKKYVFVGEENAMIIPTNSSGDVHVVDITDMSKPREVAFFRALGAGTHNFSIDEARGILYAAYYNGGVRALDVRGDLAGCTAAQRANDGRCDLVKMGREIGRGIVDPKDVPLAEPPFVWGTFYQNGYVFASDFTNGLWKLQALSR